MVIWLDVVLKWSKMVIWLDVVLRWSKMVIWLDVVLKWSKLLASSQNQLFHLTASIQVLLESYYADPELVFKQAGVQDPDLLQVS